MQGQAQQQQQQHHHQQLQHLQMSQQLQDGPRPGMQLSGLGTSNLRPGEGDLPWYQSLLQRLHDSPAECLPTSGQSIMANVVTAT